MNQIHVDDKLLRELLGLAATGTMELGGRTYTTKPVVPVVEPEPKSLKVSTLTSLVDYIKDNRDTLPLDKIIVHVDGPTTVRVLSNLVGQFKQRDCYLTAVPMLPDYANMFDQLWSKDKFIPLLQSMFLESEHRELMLDVLAHVRLENSADLKDNGVTQEVTVKTGAAFTKQVTIPNPVSLIPYCTFPDVEQPKRLFTFRMDKDARCTLIESDGGAWRQAAAISVKKFLQESLPAEVSIIA